MFVVYSVRQTVIYSQRELLSTKIDTPLREIVIARGKLRPVMRASERLSAFVRTAMEARGNPHTREIARRSRGLISHSTVAKIINGQAGEPTLNTLQGVAYAFDTNVRELFETVMGLKEPELFRASRFWEMLNEYEQIESQSHRKAVDGMLDAVMRAIRAMPPKKKPDGPLVEAVRRLR